MQFNEHWLREWLSTPLSIKEIAERLTAAGLEVDALEAISAVSKKVVVGEIVDIQPHPKADRLRICQVNVGKKKPLSIVCGASNAAVGLKAPVALIGAILANGGPIKQTELRGVASVGMLCSAVELGLEQEADGLLELSASAVNGTPLNDYLQLPDRLVSLDLTPNRGDCLSIAGIARELVALTKGRLKPLKIKPTPAKSKTKPTISLAAKKACPRYVGRIIRNVRASATTPDWLKQRLQRCGLRSISPVVDVTNYVMLELGQPMHAFDLDKLNGGIRVRLSKPKEKLTLLDGKTIDIEKDTLLIADSKRPLALAGIMGGADSAVTEDSQHILLESAYFDSDVIAGKARRYGLHTDSSHRFERGVDPTLQEQAMHRATMLLLDIVGGEAGPMVLQQSRPHIPKPTNITLRKDRLEKLLGMPFSVSVIQNILKRLGMTVRKTSAGWSVRPPAYRFDIRREVDLIEEVARVHGYKHIPTKSPTATMSMPEISDTAITEARIGQLLVDRDYQEIISYSFIDPALLQQFGMAQGAIPLTNPISSDMATMRTTLWPGLVQATAYNRNRQQSRVRLFEVGRCFVKKGHNIDQSLRIAGAVSGLRWPEQWASDGVGVDFFDIKGDVEALLALTGESARFHFENRPHPALQPGQTAQICRDRQEIGWVGALNPSLVAKLDLDSPVFLFEIALLPLQRAKLPHFQNISKFPAIRRDLALVVAEETSAQTVLDCVRKSVGSLLVNLELFDEYRGEGIDSGRKSLALGLTFQDSSRTLKEEAVDTLVAQVLAEVRTNLGGHLRE